MAAVPDVPMTITGIHRCWSEIPDAVPTPGGVLHVRREQATDARPEERERDEHQDQGEQEVGRGEAEKADQGQPVITPAVLVRRRVDPDRERHQPGEQDRAERDDEGEEEPLPDDVGHRPVVLEGVPHVSLHEPRDPQPVLLPHRLVQPELLAEELDLLEVRALARRLEVADQSRQEVAGRQLDDHEGDDRDEEQGRQHEQEALDEIPAHRSAALRPGARVRHPAAHAVRAAGRRGSGVR